MKKMDGIDEYEKPLLAKMFLCSLDCLQRIIRKKKVILKIKGKWVKNAEETIAECACVTADKVCSLIP